MDKWTNVLILVLMERYSQSSQVGAVNETNVCLNPCSNGRYSQSGKPEMAIRVHIVLILVLMEDTLRGVCIGPFSSEGSVLILVLMEDTLRASDSGDDLWILQS